MSKFYINEKQEDEKKGNSPDVFAEKFIKTRQILLSGEINKDLAEKFNKQLLLLEADNNDPVYVYIDHRGCYPQGHGDSQAVWIQCRKDFALSACPSLSRACR